VVSSGRENSVRQPAAEALSARTYFERLSELIPQLPYPAIDAIGSALLRAFAEDRTVFVFGNGGSAASASHMMVDMNKGITESAETKRLKVIALTDNVPLLTAWANDSGYEYVFSEQLKNFVRRGDVAFAISGSGNSQNVLLALKTARACGAVTLGVAGYQGGKMRPLCDVCAVVPSDNMQMIEDLHHAMLHSIFAVLRARLRTSTPEGLSAVAGRFQK
jgi:D-sedoheptulose 7-phosphate isomerase